MRHSVRSRILICSLAVAIVLPCVLLGPSAYRKIAARHNLREALKAYSAKDYEAAERCFLRAKQLDHELIEAQVGLVRLYNLTGGPDPVSSALHPDFTRRNMDMVAELLRMDPSNHYGLDLMAQYCDAIGDRQQAKLWWRRCASLYPAEYEPLFRIGAVDWQLIYDQTGGHRQPAPLPDSEQNATLVSLADEGIAALKEAIRRKPDHDDSYAYVALLYREKAKLASEPSERKQWLREADLTALEAAKLRKRE